MKVWRASGTRVLLSEAGFGPSRGAGGLYQVDRLFTATGRCLFGTRITKEHPAALEDDSSRMPSKGIQQRKIWDANQRIVARRTATRNPHVVFLEGPPGCGKASK